MAGIYNESIASMHQILYAIICDTKPWEMPGKQTNKETHQSLESLPYKRTCFVSSSSILFLCFGKNNCSEILNSSHS